MIDLQGDEKVILQLRKSMATLVPQALCVVIVGFVAYWVAKGFYLFRDHVLFKDPKVEGPKLIFNPPEGSWFAHGVHQNILILGGLVFLILATWVGMKIFKGRRAAKRMAAGLPPKPPKQPRLVMATPATEQKALVHRSSRRLTSYYKVERYLTAAAMVVFVGFGIFGWEAVAPGYFVVVTVAPLTTYIFFRWYMTRYALTSKRLVISAGLISSFFWDLPFDKYDEISGEQNFIERILMFGDLTVNSVGGSREVIRHVPHPEYMRKSFHAMREEYRKRLMESALGRGPEAPAAPPAGENKPENAP
jgi:hypothetical protein